MPRTCTSGSLRPWPGPGSSGSPPSRWAPRGPRAPTAPPPDGNLGDGHCCRSTFPMSSMPAFCRAQLSTASLRGPALGHGYSHPGWGDNGLRGSGARPKPPATSCVAEKHEKQGEPFPRPLQGALSQSVSFGHPHPADEARREGGPRRVT